jgi:hypothetical protein
MAEHRTDPTAQIPEADLLEQQSSLDAQPPTGEPDWVTTSDLTASTASLVDEADLLEQMAQLPGQDEDDYPREPPGGKVVIASPMVDLGLRSA